MGFHPDDFWVLVFRSGIGFIEQKLLVEYVA